MNDNTEDKHLVDQCIDADKLSCRILFDGYINLVFNAASNTIAKHGTSSNRHDIEDICQTVFLNLFRDDCKILKRYDSTKAAFSTWLTIVTRNVAIDFLRKKKSHVVTMNDVIETIHCPRSIETTTIDIPGQVISPRQHLVLRMMYDDGLDVAEVAYFLGVKRQTIRSLHHRALKKLRAHYGVKTPPRPSLQIVNNNG